tara:strand:+ start:246 stop:1016 length:771 start_codon:yes stop_codon:yes gene_type:complete
MAFKMKAGKEGPMKKNFPGAFKATTVKTSDDTKMSASKAGITVTGKGGKVSKYAPGDAGYNAAKQTYIDAGGESPMGMKSPKKLGSSTGMSGAQGRAKMRKPMAVDVDGNPVTEGGRRNYTPASVGTVLGGTSPNNMKSPKKAKAKKAATGEGIAVYNNQGELHQKYNPGDMGYNQALMMLQNQAPSPNQMKKSAMMMKKSAMELEKAAMKMMKESPKKIVKTNTRKSAMKISQATMNPTQAKKTASTRRKKNVGK